jgi:hypothetical protein
MKLKAKDTLFISSVSSENILPGGTFEVSDAEGKRLIDRGLASAVKSKASGKAAQPAKNKMQPTTLNKAGK